MKWELFVLYKMKHILDQLFVLNFLYDFHVFEKAVVISF